MGRRDHQLKVGQPYCRACNGTTFTAKRGGMAKATVGVMAPKNRLKCSTCGAEYHVESVARGLPTIAVGGASIAPVVPQAPPGQPAGWYPDPLGRHELRWWGGVSWMDAVRDGDLQDVDPVEPAGSGGGTPQPRTVGEQLRELASLRDEGLLTEAEYEEQKARLLA
jgi:hypothetical protein